MTSSEEQEKKILKKYYGSECMYVCTRVYGYARYYEIF